MKAGLLRLTLIISSLTGLILCFILLTNYTPRPHSHPRPLNPLECRFFLGLKPPVDDVFSSTLLQKKSFFSFASPLSSSLKKESFGFVFSIFLTKDKKWIVSNKPFVLNSQGRTEISYLSSERIKKQFKTPLFLKDVLQAFPQHILFLRISTKDPERAFKNLKFLYARPNTLVTSQNEELLQALLRDRSSLILVHSFRSLVRFQFMNLLGARKIFPLPATGIEIPSSFALSQKTAFQLKNRGKHLYLEKEAPLSDIPTYLIPLLSGLITSNIKEGTQFIKNKNPCLKKL